MLICHWLNRFKKQEVSHSHIQQIIIFQFIYGLVCYNVDTQYISRFAKSNEPNRIYFINWINLAHLKLNLSK